MSAPGTPAVTQARDLEGEADAVILACGGDARAAVKALLVANGFLEREAARLRRDVSFGFTRGKGSAARHASGKVDGWREISPVVEAKPASRDGPATAAPAAETSETTGVAKPEL